MKTVKILWRSSHPPTKRHRELIQKIYDEADEPCQVSIKFDRTKKWIFSAESVLEEFKQGEYDDIFINAPGAIISAVANLGLHPLYAIIEDGTKDDHDFFDGSYKKVARIERFRKIFVDTYKAEPFGALQT